MLELVLWELDLSSKYLLSVYNVPVSDLSTRDTTVNKTKRIHSFLEFTFEDKEQLTNTFEYLPYAEDYFKCCTYINYFAIIP